MLKKYKCVKQYSLKDCAASALKTVLLEYGSDAPLSVLTDMCKTTKMGTNAYNLINAAKELGFDSKGLKINIDDLLKNKYKYPLIAHVIIDKKYKHYVVIHKIYKRRKKILIADPARGLKTLTFKEFEKIWTNIIITVVPISSLPSIEEYKTNKEILFELLTNYKKEIVNIFLISIFYTICSIGSSFYFKYIIDNKSLNNLYVLSFITFILIAFKVIFNSNRNKLLLSILEKIDFNIHSRVFRHIISLPYRIIKNKTTGEVISRINDLSNIRELLTKIIINVGMDLITALFGLIILYFISPKLLTIAIIILLLYLIIYYLFKNILTNLTNKTYEEYSKYNSYMNEAILALETVKSNNIENIVESIYENKYINILKASIKRNLIEINSISFKDLINLLGNAFVLFIGAMMVVEGSITLGTLIIFVNIMSYFLNPIRNLIDMDYMIRNSNAALNRIKDLLQIKPEAFSGIQPSKIEGNIKISNLTFTYDNSKNILKSINLEIKKGEKVLITGKSGCGKSTLLKLLYGYYSIERGTIFIDDIDLLDYNKKYLRKKINYISQQEHIFTDSIYNNITCYRKANHKTVLNISNIVNINEFIREENYGYDFLLEENGFNISGGQKQRIILARGLLFAQNIILLDEATNELNQELERKILTNLFSKYINNTFIIVSHRNTNKDLFDKIFNMNNGVLEVIKV